MKNLFSKKSLSAITVMWAILMLTMVSNSAKATVYQTILWDDYAPTNDAGYCSCDTFKCVPPAGGTNISWYVSGATQVLHGDTLLLPNGFDGQVKCIYNGTSKYLMVHPIIILITPTFSNTTVCGNGTITLDALNQSQYGFVSYLWSNGATTQTITVGAGTYSVTVSDVCESITHSATITESNPMPPDLGLDQTVCGGQGIILSPGAYPWTNYLWSTGVTTSTLTVYTSGSYWVSVTNPGGCNAEDLVYIHFLSSPTQDIGLISIDTSTVQGNNQVVWDTTQHPTNVNLVKFKRELTTNNYVVVGTAPYTDGKWTDTVSSSTQTWRYKISLVDTCGNESVASGYNQSIHSWVMPVAGGHNIEWTQYLVEGNPSPVLQYNIYSGPSLNELSLLTFVSGNVFTYKPTGSDSMYVIGAVRGSKGLLTEALSNPVNLQDTLGINEIKNTISFDIYPNPVTNTVTIQTENIQNVQLMDVVGRIILTTTQKTIDCSRLPNGVYFIKVITKKGIGVQRFIKQ